MSTSNKPINKLHTCSKEDLCKTGVYTITSKQTGKVYVGSTAGALGFIGRWSAHLTELKKGKHKNKYLLNHFNKYGESDLQFDILDICEPRFVLSSERFWIDMLDSVNSGFNLSYPEHCPFRQFIKIKYDKLNHKEIIGMYKDRRLTAFDIGRVFNVNYRLVCRVLKENNIKTRQRRKYVKHTKIELFDIEIQ